MITTRFLSPGTHRLRRIHWLGPLAVALVALAGCYSDAPKSQPENDVLVRTARVTRAESAQTYRLTGVTQAAKRADLSFQVSGRLAERNADVGDAVERGGLLARLDTPQLDPARDAAKASVQRLETQLANARESTARTARLVEQDAATQQQLDDARTQRDSLAAQLAQARAEVSRATRSADQQRLTAPIAGSVTDVFFQPGEFIPAGQPVMALSGAGGLEARFGVPEQLVPGLTSGQRVRLSLPLGSGGTLTGRLIRLARATGGPGQLFRAVIHIDDTGEVGPGESVVWHVRARARNDLLVPIAALARIGRAQTAVVYVIEDDIARRVPVTPGALVDARVRVSGDLAAGDAVAVAGLSHLTDGQTIRRLGPDDD